MGQWLAKEWKAVDRDDSADAQRLNREPDFSVGEPKSLSAPAHDRLRVLKEDPRSPSGSISRTPIEVVATPDQKRDGDEYSPAPSPAVGRSPGVGLLKKSHSGDTHRRMFQRNPPPKFQAFENDAGEEMES